MHHSSSDSDDGIRSKPGTVGDQQASQHTISSSHLCQPGNRRMKDFVYAILFYIKKKIDFRDSNRTQIT